MNDSNSEIVTLEVDPEPAVKGAAAGNAALDGYSKKAAQSVSSASKAWEDHGGVVVRVADRTQNSVNRLVAALEKQAATYGKTGVDRLIAQRDQMIQRLGNEEAAVRRVTAAYAKMIATESAMSAAGGGAESGTSGFRLNYAIRGVKDIAEGRGTFALAEATNILMALRGSALVIGGITAGLAGAGIAAYEFKKHLDEVHAAAEKAHGEFLRFGDSQKLANAEAQVTNDRLQNTIAKLEHRPENGLKLAIDEAAVSALHLSQRIDKSIDSFYQLAKSSEPGTFAKIFTNKAGFEDIAELVGGKSGYGGMRASIYNATRNGGDPTETLSRFRGQTQKMLAQTQAAGKFGGSGLEGRVEVLQALLGELDDQQRAFDLDKRNAADEKRKEVLESRAAALEKVIALEKRAEEAIGKSIFGTDTPMGRFEGSLYDLGVQRDDSLRVNPGNAGRIRNAYNRLASADRNTLLDALRRDTERSDIELEGSENFGKGPGEDLAHVLLKRIFSGTEKALRSSGVIDEHGSLTAAIAGQLTAPIPEGYVSPQQQLQTVRRQERGYLGLYGLRAGLSGLGPEAQAEGVYGARIQFADKEYEAQLRIADAITETQKRDEARVAALNDREEKRFEAQMEREQKLLEIDKQHFDQIKQISGGLYHTLFTNPRQFGGQLLGTVREAALHPVIDRLSTMTAQVLTPLFSPGGGGLSDIRLVGGAVPVHIVGGGPVASSFSGGGVGGVFGGGGLFGGGGASSSTGLYDLPMAGTPAAIAASGSGILGSFGGLSSIVGGPGGTSGFAGRVGGFGGIFGGGSGGLGGMLSRKGISGLLSGLKGNFWNEDINLAPGVTQAASSMGLGGKLAGVLTSKGAASLEIGAGLPLAMAGITGNNRGTLGGVVEDFVGGGLTGAGIGTMILPGIGTAIGAGIGAAVGAGIGFGEMAFGVESKPHEAHRLIQSIYGVNIPEGGGLMAQIVAAAQQYGGSVSMAVRTPQVRQLIELYSMSTGQRSNLFLDTPHGASLVQQGGKLYQGLSYFNGSGYNYASSLPTLGNSAGTIPTYNPYQGGPYGPTSIHLDGPATTALLTGQVVKTANPAYVSNQNMAALQSGDSRARTAAALMSPQTIFA